MRTLKSVDNLADEVFRIVLAAGFFDGMHLGHRDILTHAAECARATGSETWVLTFEPHPLNIIAPQRKPGLLTSLDLRLEFIGNSGVDGCLLLPFTKQLSELTPVQFVHEILGGWMNSEKKCTVVSGNNWRFGKERSGKLSDIETLSGGAIKVSEVPTVVFEGSRISSSRIRAEIQSGNLEKATAMLGHPHLIRERTISGAGMGTKLGFATANIMPRAEVMPPPRAIYEVAVSRLCHKGDGWMKGVANYGFRPTFPDACPEFALLEVHILDFKGNLHGEVLDVVFVRKIRDEMKFESKGDLVRQMKADVESVRTR